MKKRNCFLSILTFVLLIFLSSNCTKDKSTDSNIDYQKLETAFDAASQIGNLKCLVVFQNDSIIKQAYFSDGGADTRHSVRSVTKSVVSILIGIAIDKGYLTSVEQTLGEFIDPEVYNITPQKAAITIRHLLTMTSGFEWNELTASGYNDWVLSENQVQYILDKPLAAQPGQTFTYNSACTHLLSFIITKASGMSTYEFSLKYLFNPIGIEEVDWYIDKQGYCNGGAGLVFTPHDMIKIGQLILNKGVYNGNVIVSSNYIEQSIQPKVSVTGVMSFASNYGYCWWLGSSNGNSYVFANGYGGQFIVIVPSKNLIVVATNTWSGIQASAANEQWYRTLDIIVNSVITAFN